MKDVSAETFADAIEQEDPNRYQDLLEHTRADALITIAEHFMATSDQHPHWQGLTGSERCQVMLHVDATTCKPKWDGDRCDYGIAVEALLKRDGRFMKQDPVGP